MTEPFEAETARANNYRNGGPPQIARPDRKKAEAQYREQLLTNFMEDQVAEDVRGDTNVSPAPVLTDTPERVTKLTGQGSASTVLGMDGKTYTRPAPAPEQKPTMTTRRDAADVHGQVTALISARLAGIGSEDILVGYLKDAPDPLRAAASIALVSAGVAAATLLNIAGGDRDAALKVLGTLSLEREEW